MRQVLNISLPIQMANNIKKIVRKDGYSSVSEFIRHLYRSWEENKIYNELLDSKKEFQRGKAKLLTSLKELR